jgi:predicted enzyme related to lactoylglutathione lyase
VPGTQYFQVNTGPATAPGIHGDIVKRRTPGVTISVTIAVDSLADTIERLVKAGGLVVTQPVHVPGYGLHAYCRDPEGNIIGLIQQEQT